MPRQKWLVFTRKNSRSTVSQQKGIAIVEMLIAILVLSFLMIGVLDAMAKVRRQATSLQNQTLAANIAQELMDAARNQTWQTLTANVGSKSLSGQFINHSSGSLTGGLSYLPRPLVLDQANNLYSTHTWDPSAQTGNNFRGSATQTITMMNANTLSLSVTVNWPDEHGAGTRALSSSTVITRNGIHNY